MIATVCSGGKRSGLAASILQREGYGSVIHVGHGGVGTWERGGHPVESQLTRRPYPPRRPNRSPPTDPLGRISRA